MRIKVSLMILISGFLILSGCRENANKEIIIENEFVEYVDRFVAEAAARGIEIDFSDTGLLIEFRDAVSTESGGVCYLGRHHIQIEKFFWDGYNDLQREGLIFHELGHCELGRLHKNDTLPNGEWLSRMRGDPLPDNASFVINYTGTRKDYYVDELFDETTPVPDWVSISANYDDYTAADKEELVRIDEANEFDESLGLSTSLNFEIEFELDNGASEDFVGVLWGGRENSNSIRIAFNGFRRFIIDSGNQVFGTMRDYPTLSLLNNDFNKITIRKIEDKYYVFVNEAFLYWFDFITPANGVVSSLFLGATPPEYRNITISKLLK